MVDGYTIARGAHMYTERLLQVKVMPQDIIQTNPLTRVQREKEKLEWL